MFWTYFKSSIKALPWIILLPVAAFVLYILLNNYSIEEDIFSSFDDTPVWFFVFINMLVAIVLNFLFLMIIPSAVGGINPSKKKGLFYLGFFVILCLSIIAPIIPTVYYGLETDLTIMLIGLHLLAFLVPYICGALFVAPAYARVFWFWERKKGA